MRSGRSARLRLAVAGFALGVLSALHAQDRASGADYLPGMPFTYLFDTCSSSPRPLTGRALAAKTGWTLLPEDKVTHKFEGDVVLLNDKLAVVLRRSGPGAEVYSQTATGLKRRAVLVPLPRAGRSVVGLSSVVILENNPGAVMLDTTLRTARGSRSSVKFRLTTGRQILEVRPGKAADRLVVWSKTRYVVVPDFFGDDMVFGPEAFDTEAFDRPRLGLPTENFFLNLLEGGDAMLMCVWRSSKQGADALVLDDGRRRVIGGCQLECAKDKSVWIALMEHPGIWHEQTIPAGDAETEIAADWKPPFAAKWRADFVQPDGAARSWNLGSTGQIPPAAERYPGPILVYPIDRSRATPLTAFCPIDVLRNALGVGPCQYILQTEGLASDTKATPDQVINWVEKQFEKKKEKTSAEQIKEYLRQMTEHVGHVQARIQQYAGFAEQVRALCAAEDQNKDGPDAVQTLSRIVDRMERTIATGRGTTEPSARAAQLADEIAGLIGRHNPLADCRRLGAEVRRIGAVQDRTLSKCRMAVRWLRQQARMSAAEGADGAATAKKVRALAERMLHEN